MDFIITDSSVKMKLYFLLSEFTLSFRPEIPPLGGILILPV